MKTMCWSLLAIVLAFHAEGEPPASSALDRATVTIPYAELRGLWEAAHARRVETPAPAPPVGSIVHSAELQLRLGETTSALEAVFDVEALDSRWQSIRLIGGDVQLDASETNDQAIVWQDGYSLLTNKPQRSRVKLQFSAAGLKSLTEPRALKVQLDGATVKRLRVAGVPAGVEVRANDQPATSFRDSEATFALPGAAGEIRVQLTAPRPEPPPPRPSQWQAQAQVLALATDGRLKLRARVFAHADSGSGLEASFALPANAASVSVTGDDIAESQVERAEDGRTVHVRWKTLDILDRELTILWALPQSPLAEQWLIQAPTVAGAAESRNFYAVSVPDSLEFKGDGLRLAADAQRLPEWMRSDLQRAVIVTAEAGARLVLEAKPLPMVATADAIISEAKAELRLVSDGSMQISTMWTIRHQASLPWRLELPADVELLTCTVASRPARPVQREVGVIEILLPAPEAKPSPPPGKASKDAAPPPSDTGVTQVTLVYAAKTAALDPVSGQGRAVELPRTPLFVERLELVGRAAGCVRDHGHRRQRLHRCRSAARRGSRRTGHHVAKGSLPRRATERRTLLPAPRPRRITVTQHSTLNHSMTTKRLIAIAIIVVCTSLAWFILAGAVQIRSENQRRASRRKS